MFDIFQSHMTQKYACVTLCLKQENVCILEI